MSSNLHLVITVHGILTYGQWQSRLKKLLESAEPGITVLNEKYGYFSILAFLFPPTRWLVTRRFRQGLLEIIRSKPWSRIDLVGHSFGTHLIGWGLQGIATADRPHIHTVVLAGSVLKSGFLWGEFIGKCVKRLVNECGTKDDILILNQLFVLFTGMAGRLGFHGLTGDTFQNRYHQFGHSDYFVRDGEAYDEFMRTAWLPLLTSDGPILEIDDRQYPKGWKGALAGMSLWALNNAEPIKLTLYVAPFVVLTIWIYTLYQNAQRERQLAVARQLAAQSEVVRDLPGFDIDLSGLLAVESMKASETLEGFASLKKVLNVLPRPVKLPLQSVKLNYDESVAVSPDGKYLATVDSRGAILLWDLASATKQGLAQSGFGLSHLVFSGDGSRLAATRGDTVYVWDVMTASKLFKSGPGHNKPIATIAFSHDGKALATESYDHVVQVWSFTDQREIFRRILPPATTYEAWSPLVLALDTTGRYLARGHGDTVQVWDTKNSANPIWSLPQSGAVHVMAFSYEVGYLAVLDEEALHIYSPENGRLIADTPLTDENIDAIAFGGSALNPILATAGKSKSILGGTWNISTVRIWRMERLQPLEIIFRVDVRHNVKAMTFAQDRQSIGATEKPGMIIAVLDDGTVSAWNVTTGVQIAEISPVHLAEGSQSRYGEWQARLTDNGAVRVWDVAGDHQIGKDVSAKGARAGTISDDGQWVAIANGVGEVRIYAIRTERPVVSVKWNPLDSAWNPWALSSSANGQRLVVGGDGTAYVWEVATGRLIAQMGEGVIDSVAMNSDGRLLASSGAKGTTIWDVEGHHKIASLDRKVNSMLFSTNGGSLITSSNSGVEVWDVGTGRRRSQLTDVYSTRLALTPNGRWLAVEDLNGWLRVIDMDKGQPVFEIKPTVQSPADTINVGFSRDGHQLVSGYLDKTFIWPWQKQDLIDEACDRLQRNLTSEERSRYLDPGEYRPTCPNLHNPRAAQ